MLTTGGAIALSLVAGVGIARMGNQFWTEVKSVFYAPPPEPEVDVRSVVLEQVRELSELSTASFAMEAVVPTKQDRTLGQLTLGTTTLLYIARGEVRAGVDLAQLQPMDISVSPDRAQIAIRLPEPRLLDQKIDVSRSTVYDYDRGFLGLGPDSAVTLQSLANQKALEKIVATACEAQILEQANQRAQAVVTQLMQTAGFRQVTVQTQPATRCEVAAIPDAANSVPNLSTGDLQPPVPGPL